MAQIVRAYTKPVSHLDDEDFYPLIKLAIEEDSPYGDVTTDSLFTDGIPATAHIVNREEGIICGLGVLSAIDGMFPGSLNRKIHVEDGNWVDKNTIVATIEGDIRFLLRMERILLNFLQYMSGISTQTHRIVTQYPNLHILDTRKTLPGYRKLVKYCVYKGGGWNHRIHLSDMAMIKDNHLAMFGSISKAVSSIRSKHPELKIELEIDSLDQLEEAIQSRPNILLLDNFSIQDIEIALQRIRESQIPMDIEVSGGLTPEKLKFLSKFESIGVSMGYLTHTTKFLDIGLDMEV